MRRRVTSGAASAMGPAGRALVLAHGLLLACNPAVTVPPRAPRPEVTTPKGSSPNYGALPLRASSGAYQAVIEIPAGTNDKREYDAQTNTFPVDRQAGRKRVVAYLPYPGNYGFLPGTLMAAGQGGDGDPLDVVVLGLSVPTATVLEIDVLGVLRLRDTGEADDKIIALPRDPEYRVMDADELDDLPAGVLEILEQWFGNYKGPGRMEVLGWGGRAEAERLIARAAVAGPARALSTGASP